MTSTELLGEWMDAALAAAPQDLAMRIRTSLPDGWRDVAVGSAAPVLVDAAAAELRILLARGCDTRWAAPGLLAVDALVTHACELIAIVGTDIDEETDFIIERIGQVAKATPT